MDFFFFSSELYIAIIGDIKESRKIEDRSEVQKNLKGILKKINQIYEKDISSKFIITLGDEFQGLLCNGENILHIIEDIQREMYPIEIRFGIGVGGITTKINTEMAIGADGPGYYMARNAIERLKYDEQKNKTCQAEMRIEIDGDEQNISMLINTIFSLINTIKSEWTNRQREIIQEIEKYGGSQAECAKRLGVSQSTIYRGLNSGNYYAYKNAKDTVNYVLKEIKYRNV